MKIEATYKEKIISKHMLDKRLVFNIKKDYLKLNSKTEMSKIKQGRYSDQTVEHIMIHGIKEHLKQMLQVMSLL